ncbi:MAG: hypothetical protein ACWGO1_12150 [Anaerolineales bacterium]
MDQDEMEIIAQEIASFVIDNGRVEEGEGFLASLGLEVLVEADDRGYENATEISELAVQMYSK